jgi:predicted RND superfamily exporter protein
VSGPSVYERAAALGLRRPRTVLAAAGFLAGLSVASGLAMRFRSDVSDMVPAADAPLVRVLEDVFGATDGAFLLVTAGPSSGEADLLAFARAFEERIRGEPDVRAVTHGWAGTARRLMTGDLLARAPLFARPEEVAAVDRLLTPEGVAEAVEKQSHRLSLPGGGGEAAEWAARDPLELGRFIASRLGSLRGSFRFRRGSMDFVSEDGRSLLVRIEGNARADDIARVKPLVRAIRGAAAAARDDVAGARGAAADIAFGLTGGYAFAAESEAALRSDLTRNVTWSVILVLALIGWATRRVLLVVPAFLTLALGIAIGFGAFSLLRRDVAALALVSGAILAGLGVDFVIHLVLPALARGGGPTRAAVLGAAREAGPSLLFAALTTAAAFLAFLIVGERFLGDLGLLSACGILSCLAASLVVLPAALGAWVARAEAAARSRARPAGRAGAPPRSLGTGALAAAARRAPHAVLAAAAVLSAAALGSLAWRPPGLEEDLRRLHPRGSEAIAVQERIAATFGGGGDPLLLVIEAEADAATDPRGRALAAAARLEPRLRTLEERGLIAAWLSPAHLVPPAPEQEAVIEVLARKDAGAIEAAFRAALDAEGFDPAAFAGAIAALREALALHAPIGPAGLDAAGLGDELGRLLGARGGKGYALVAVHPAAGIWKREEERAVSGALAEAMAAEGVTGQVGGLLAMSVRSASLIVEEFLEVSAAAAAAVVLLVAVLFRRPAGALALLPVALGALWTAAACGALGIRLNFMNVGILPMVLGIGVDSGIHMVRRWLDHPARDAAAVLRAAGPAVILSALTTVAAFGTMAFSTSPGIASVGAVAGIGVTACLAASTTALPAALELLSRRAGNPPAPPRGPRTTG